MNNIHLRGEGGDVRYVYHRAASLGAWTIGNGRITATLRQADAFRLSQSPLRLEVRRPQGAVWSWRLTDVLVTGAELSATLVEESGES